MVLDEDLDGHDVDLVESRGEGSTELLELLGSTSVLVGDHVVRVRLRELRHRVGNGGSDGRGDGERLVHFGLPLFDMYSISDSRADVNTYQHQDHDPDQSRDGHSNQEL